MSKQNTSHAVMARRHEEADSADYFPTPPWATRALLQVLAAKPTDTCWEPACGGGHMARPLGEFFKSVTATDLHDYGYGSAIVDFLSPLTYTADWIITNPPFNKAEEFATTALHRASKGVALLVRTSFIEGVGRYERLFTRKPPTMVLQFSERVPMHKGKLTKTGSTATAYAWVIWDKRVHDPFTQLHWTGVVRKELEKDSDYD